MSESTSAKETNRDHKQDTENSQGPLDNDSSSSGSSSSSDSGQDSHSQQGSDGQQETGNSPQDESRNEQESWKEQEPTKKLEENKEESSFNHRGNNGFPESSFQNFNPKFTFGEDEEEQTRDQYRNGGGFRGGRGNMRGGRGGRGGGFDRGSGFDRNDRGGRGGRGGRVGSDRGFDDRGGRGGRGGDRGGGRGGRGGFGGQDNFSIRDNSFGNRENSGFGLRNYGNRDGHQSNRSFNNQNQNQLSGSKSSNNMRTSNYGDTKSNFQQLPPQVSQIPQQFSGMVPGQLNQPGMFPVNYIPYIASDPSAAFKKKPGFSEEQKLVSSKVSKVSKVSKAPSKAAKKDKKKKKRKNSSSSSDSSSSRSRSSSSDSEADKTLNMSLCNAAMDNDNSIIHGLDDLKKKQKEKRNEKKRFTELMPEGRKDWPGAKLYVLGNILEITFRNITEHSDCVLVIPYEDTSMSLYPGTIVNKGEIDYREKLEQKNNVLKPGSVYTQDNFLSKEFLYHCIAFVKIDKESVTIENGLKYIFDTLEKLQKKFKHLKNLVIPLSMFTYHPNMYQHFIKKVCNLMESKKFKSVTLTTRSKEEYEMGMKAFTELTCEMIKRNEIGA